MILGTLAVAACGSSSSSPPKTTSGGSTNASSANAPASLKLMLDYIPEAQHVGIYWALNKGLFKKENQNVSIVQPPSTTSPLTFIALHKVDLAIYYEPDTLSGYQQNGDKVQAVGTLIPRPLAALEFAPGVKNGTVASLKGKTVAWFGIAYEKAFMSQILKTAGLTLNDITFVNAGFNASTDLAAGKVDASVGAYYITVPGIYNKPPVEAIPVNKYGVPTYDELVVEADGPRLRSDPAYASAVRRFLKAVMQGETDAIANPTEAYNIMKPYVKDTHLNVEMPAALEAMHQPFAGTPLGCLNIPDWQRFDQWMVQNKQIPSSAPVSQLATNQYMPYHCPS
jgi:putative hydroxymethylpyrimidine transport system substrate-binding protein